MSAGTRSPSPISTISPGTSSLARRSCFCPFLTLMRHIFNGKQSRVSSGENPRIVLGVLHLEENFFPYLATGRRPVARLFGTVLCTCTKSTKQGLANDGKIGVCGIVHKKPCSTLETLRATVQVLLSLSPLPGLLKFEKRLRSQRPRKYCETNRYYSIMWLSH